MRKSVTTQRVVFITYGGIQQFSMGLFSNIQLGRGSPDLRRQVVVVNTRRTRVVAGNNASRNAPGYNLDQPGLFQHTQVMPDRAGGRAQALRYLLGRERLILNNPQNTRANHIADRLELLLGRDGQTNGDLWHDNGDVIWQQWQRIVLVW